MTKYYFHIRDSREFSEDTEGFDFPDLEHAIMEADLASREMVAEMVLRGEAIDGQRFEITDTEGNILATVVWVDAIKRED